MLSTVSILWQKSLIFTKFQVTACPLHDLRLRVQELCTIMALNHWDSRGNEWMVAIWGGGGYLLWPYIKQSTLQCV